MKIKVVCPFYDLEANVERLVDDEFDVTDKRYKSLKKNLPDGYFEIVKMEKVSTEGDNEGNGETGTQNGAPEE